MIFKPAPTIYWLLATRCAQTVLEMKQPETLSRMRCAGMLLFGCEIPTSDNIMLVCCAVNQLARNQNEATPHVKHQLDLLAMRFQRSDARAGVPLGLMTCKLRDQGGMSA
jgi:hypothetical protein